MGKYGVRFMAMKMNDFILEYYKRLIFRSMPIEQFVHFCDFIKSGETAGHMKEWSDNLLEKDSSGKLVEYAGLYVRKDLPDADTELDDTEWEKFFRAFQNAFQAMDANKKSFKYEKKPNDFLNKYFGTSGQLFSYTTANPAAETKILELLNLLETYSDKLKPMLRNYFNDDFSWDDLIDGINSKKYNADPKFRDRMTSIAEALAYDTQIPQNSVVYSLISRKLDFSAISDGFTGQKISGAKMTQFKLVYNDLLNELYTNSKAFEFFSASDPTKISKSLNEAKGRLEYNDPNSKDYISPKRSDKLTLPQKVSEWWDKTYSNYLRKYVSLRPDVLFFTPQANAIFKEIDKLHLNPADGLGKVLENADKISGALKKKYKKAPDHFDWFVKTLTEMRDTMGGGKAFAKALSNGHSMHILVEQIIIKAVRENKVDEAKTTLEMLPVLRYAYTTSKVMDAFNKSDLTIFSDKDLSWNKNEAMKFITNAMDKGIKKALQLFGYTLTIAGNIIKRRGTKFNGHMGKEIKKACDATLQTQNSQLQHTKDSLDKYKSEHDVKETELASLRAAGDETYWDNEISIYTPLKDTAKINFDTSVQSAVLHLSTVLGSGTPISPDVNKLDNILNKLSSNEFADITGDVSGIAPGTPERTLADKILADQSTYKTNFTGLENARTKRQELTDATNELNIYNDLITKTEQTIADWDKNHTDKYRELMAYWDICNSGFNKSWFGSRDEQQKKFVKNSQTAFNTYLNNYSISM